MSSKRGLYHPAPTHTPPPRVSKSLVQGRLIADQLSPVAKSVPQIDSSSPTERGSLLRPAGTTPTAQRDVSRSLPLFSPAKPASSNVDTYSQEPRSPLPQTPFEVGLDQVQPLASLSLSDNEEETRARPSTEQLHAQEAPKQSQLEGQKATHTADAPSAQTPSVLMVDASGRPQSHARRDIPVLTSIVDSQVKVICHSPRGKKSQTRQEAAAVNSGNTRQAASIKVERVPHVNVMDTSAVSTGNQSLSEQSKDSSITSVSSVAGSPVDRHGQIKTTRHEEDEMGTGQYKSFLSDATDQSEPPMSANMSQAEIRQQLFNFSALDASAITSEHPGFTSSSHDKTVDSTKKKKKSKARAIPSRYMSKPVTASKDSSRMVNPKTRPSANRPKASDTSMHYSHADVDLMTPIPRHEGSKSGRIVTSTPASGSVAYPSSAAVTSARVSSVGAPVGASTDFVKPANVLPKPGLQRTALLGSAKKPGKSKAGRNTPVDMPKPFVGKAHGSHAEVHGDDGDVSQRQLELEHARLLQWIFLNSKLKDTVERQEKEARAHMFSVWQENETLRREIANLEQEVALRTSNATLDRHLDVQLNGLQPIGANMTKLILEYAQLADGLDTTRHHMPVDGVFIPSDHGSLLVTIDETERLLGEIDALTKQHQTEASRLAGEMGALKTTTDTEMKEQERCEELLSAASTLRTHECSLQAHTLQRQPKSDPVPSPVH